MACGAAGGRVGAEKEPRLDAEGREVVLGERRVALTPREFAVLRYLWEREGKVVTRDELLDAEPGYERQQRCPRRLQGRSVAPFRALIPG